MRVIAASAAASSKRSACFSSADPRLCASRNGAIQSKPHSSGRTTRFSSRVVSRVSHLYIQRAYVFLNMDPSQFYQRHKDAAIERCKRHNAGCPILATSLSLSLGWETTTLDSVLFYMD